MIAENISFVNPFLEQFLSNLLTAYMDALTVEEEAAAAGCHQGVAVAMHVAPATYQALVAAFVTEIDGLD